MNITIVRNRYLNALLIVLLGSAIFHVILLLGVLAFTGDWYAVNYFRILEIGYLFPIADSFASNALSLAVLAMLYLLVLFLNRHS